LGDDSDRAVLLLISTGGRDEAERIGEGLVEGRLAACGSVIPTIHSFYYWEGRLQREHEALLLIKTSAAKSEAAQEYIRTHHSYQLPEIVQLDVTGGSQTYIEWLLEEVRGNGPRETSVG
jgi:periplasmic divalent cation tolerance protein